MDDVSQRHLSHLSIDRKMHGLLTIRKRPPHKTQNFSGDLGPFRETVLRARWREFSCQMLRVVMRAGIGAVMAISDLFHVILGFLSTGEVWGVRGTNSVCHRGVLAHH